MTLLMKLTMATAGCSGSISANRWHTFSVVLPVRLATKPNILPRQAHMKSQNHRSHTNTWRVRRDRGTNAFMIICHAKELILYCIVSAAKETNKEKGRDTSTYLLDVLSELVHLKHG